MDNKNKDATWWCNEMNRITEDCGNCCNADLGKTLTLEMLKKAKAALMNAGADNAAETKKSEDYSDGYNHCVVEVIRKLGGHPCSKLWGDRGLLAATMRVVDGYARQEHLMGTLHKDLAVLRKETETVAKGWAEAEAEVMELKRKLAMKETELLLSRKANKEIRNYNVRLLKKNQDLKASCVASELRAEYRKLKCGEGVAVDREHLRCLNVELVNKCGCLAEQCEFLRKSLFEEAEKNVELQSANEVRKLECDEMRRRLGTVESMRDQIEALKMQLDYWDAVRSHVHNNREDEVIGTLIPEIVLRRLKEHVELKRGLAAIAKEIP